MRNRFDVAHFSCLFSQKRNVRRAFPEGASEQAKAVILAFSSGLMSGGLPKAVCHQEPP
ncbi:MAG TPA: hypothetical protein VGD05_03040 [Pyrinomonadaceae bacterium]